MGSRRRGAPSSQRARALLLLRNTSHSFRWKATERRHTHYIPPRRALALRRVARVARVDPPALYLKSQVMRPCDATRPLDAELPPSHPFVPRHPHHLPTCAARYQGRARGRLVSPRTTRTRDDRGGPVRGRRGGGQGDHLVTSPAHRQRRALRRLQQRSAQGTLHQGARRAARASRSIRGAVRGRGLRMLEWPATLRGGCCWDIPTPSGEDSWKTGAMAWLHSPHVTAGTP